MRALPVARSQAARKAACAGVRASVLTGDPGDSPIVDQRGDSTQWVGGVGIGYAFW